MRYIYDNYVTIALRDRTDVAAVVWRPVSGTAPTLMVRLPYGTHEPAGPVAGGHAEYSPYVMNLLDAGYAVVWIESRGTYRSEGTFTPVVDEPADAEDAINWIVDQEWSDGRIGAYGFSYFGMTQWAAASTGHPALKAIAPAATTMNWHSGCWYSSGGLMSQSLVAWWHAFMYLAEELRAAARGEATPGRTDDLISLLSKEDDLIRVASIAKQPVLARRWLPEYLENADYGEYWYAHDFTRNVSQMKPPALVIGGWFDLFINTQVRDWLRVRRLGGTEVARSDSRLIVGPWGHEYSIGQYPDANFGPYGNQIMADLTNEHIAFFDRHVKDVKDETIPPAPAVRIFVMGRNEWVEAEEFPLPDTTDVDFYLSGDALNSEPGDPWEKSYDFDPSNPTPTKGGALLPGTFGMAGPVDQGEINDRLDVLSFQSPVLERDHDVIGFVKARLYVASSALDTDFTAKLIDVGPDGRAVSVCDGALRMRYRAGLDDPQLLEPGRVYEVEIDVAVTAMTFRTGHRIRLDVSSSNFPRFDVNSNTGGALWSEGPEDRVVARNTIYGGMHRPSRLILPVHRLV